MSKCCGKWKKKGKYCSDCPLKEQNCKEKTTKEKNKKKKKKKKEKK